MSFGNEKSIFGRGPGRGRKMGRGGGQTGAGRPGPGGFCVCPECGWKVEHKQGLPCYSVRCSGCGTRMVREKVY